MVAVNTPHVLPGLSVVNCKIQSRDNYQTARFSTHFLTFLFPLVRAPLGYPLLLTFPAVKLRTCSYNIIKGKLFLSTYDE